MGRAVRLLARDARRRQGRPARAALHRRRRHPAALRRRHLRRGHHLLRAAQHRRPRGRPARDASGDPPRRPPGGLRVQPPDVGAVPARLPGVPDEGAAGDRARRLLLARRLRLPRRVDPGLARPGRPRRPDRRRRVGLSRVAQPLGRHRGVAPRHRLTPTPPDLPRSLRPGRRSQFRNARVT
ncbi:hypothetical protein NOCARDAX2BIS_470025 [Nocardioides sp. AX2bis]|nr:hypothetical protein NOCARDAX2BIS_470025 [Nocardioides sp. AX2bis]